MVAATWDSGPPQETRLFPKGNGAAAYKITGLAARCDMVVLSDTCDPQTHVHRRPGCEQYRHIFLSLRAPFIALQFFTQEVLPKLVDDFVLVSGSSDLTLPDQTDRRWRRFTCEEHAMMDQILSHPRLLHWYAENLDRGGHPKRSPLPLGMVYPRGRGAPLSIPTLPPVNERPYQVLCAHRPRKSPQWETRRHVSALAQGPWKGFCTVPEGELPEEEFMRAISEHRFVICAEGGGLDPSPKAWVSLIHGAIPIIRRTALADAYAHLPVAIVDDWSEDALSMDRLGQWQARLAPALETLEGRRMTEFRLSMDYWWQLVTSGTAIRAPARTV